MNPSLIEVKRERRLKVSLPGGDLIFLPFLPSLLKQIKKTFNTRVQEENIVLRPELIIRESCRAETDKSSI